MGLYCEFDVINDFGYLDETEEYSIIPDYSDGNEIFISVFLRTARELVPVDTGYLRSTIQADSDGDSFCYCETDCEYAQYVEYGTYKMDAQPYFEPAIEAALAAARPYWDAAEREALEEEEMLAMEEEEEEETMMSSRGEYGGINTSSFGGFLGSILASFIVAFVVVTIQVLFGADFSSNGGASGSSRGRGGGGGDAVVFMPPIEIT